MPPNLGQGANSALVDAVVLAEELASAASVKNALVAYDKRRRPIARRVQKAATMLQRLCGIERVTALRARDALLGDWPGSRGSVRRPSVGPWPRTSELSDRHPCSATRAERTIARESHSGRARSLRWPTLRTRAVRP